jgi:hypothetical protein
MIRATLSGLLVGCLVLASLIALLEWTRIEPVEHTDGDGPAMLPERWAPGTYWDRRGDLEDGR